MNAPLCTQPPLVIPPEVQRFAAENGVGRYLGAVIDLARQAYPSCAVCLSLGQDAEEEAHRYIAIDVESGGLSAEELLTGQRAWTAGVRHVCPAPLSVCFVLGWR